MVDAADPTGAAREADDGRRAIVCIPTYRRPVQLARLLRALERQRSAPPFDILIGNNEPRALDSYPELTNASLPPYTVIEVEIRGVSAVRNALVAQALSRAAYRWIAFVDDDQVPSDDWLAAIVGAGDDGGADLVGGPVERSTSERTFWSAGATDTSYLPKVAGPVETLNEAGNLLIATAFLQRIDRPPFDIDFGRTGGEDYEFFLYAKSRGARIVWAPAARVNEPLPVDRLTFRSFWWRFYAIAAYQARADRTYRGVGPVIRSVVYEAVKGPVIVVRSLVAERSPARAVSLAVQRVAIFAGRIVGLFGTHAERYGSDGR